MPATPSLEHEQRLWERGFHHVAGVDEAGRGCLAGPVVAAAVILPHDLPLSGVRDSKLLSAAQREDALARIQDAAVAVGVGLCSPEEIDRINILQAALEAMRRAVASLAAEPHFLLVDGNRCFDMPPCPHATVVKGDRHSLTIAAASIVAKTARDRIMADLDAEFPGYGWGSNKGYPTKEHYAALGRHGATPYHRRTFRLTPR